MGLSPKAILLTGAALWVALPAAAQDTIELEAIRVESAGAQEVLGTTVITEEDLAVRNPQTTADVFRGDSSVAVSGGPAIAQKVFVNGIEESMLSVTIDGARQNKSAFHHTGNILFDPFLLKRVEVSSGICSRRRGAGRAGRDHRLRDGGCARPARCRAFLRRAQYAELRLERQHVAGRGHDLWPAGRVRIPAERSPHRR